MFLELKHVSKTYGGKNVVDEANLHVKSGEFVSIVGPSGAGKTTLLKMIAGLEQPDRGEIRFERMPTKKQPVILVFQDNILFPFLSVFENVAFGLRARRFSEGETNRLVKEMLDWFGIAEKAPAYPATLSAGQRQRVALARALIVTPGMLLLDEPFANLDTTLKSDTAGIIRDTQSRFGITTVCVTHDIDQALGVSDRIGVMLDGRIQQFDKPEAIFYRPTTIEVARFLGPVNRIVPELFPFLGLGDYVKAGAAGREFFLRAEAFTVEKDDGGEGRIVGVQFAGQRLAMSISILGEKLLVNTLDNGFHPGDRVRLGVNSKFIQEGKHE